MNSHKWYAEKHGYDHKIVDMYLFGFPPKLTFILSQCLFGNQHRRKEWVDLHKWLVYFEPWASNYDYIVVVDRNVLINPSSPSIHNCVNMGNGIGCVDIHRQQEQCDMYGGRHPQSLYSFYGIRCTTNKIVGTSVIVGQPKKHTQFVSHMLQTYMCQHECVLGATQYSKGKLMVDEQMMMGRMLLDHGAITWLPKKFNWQEKSTRKEEDEGIYYFDIADRVDTNHDEAVEDEFRGCYFMAYSGDDESIRKRPVTQRPEYLFNRAWYRLNTVFSLEQPCGERVYCVHAP